MDVRSPWIEGRRTDLTWYVLSPLYVLGYLPLAWVAARLLTGPDGAPLWAVSVGARSMPLTAGAVVLISWALLLDGPHFFPTLARTVLDPDEWRTRGGVLARSFALFLLGPAIVAAPWIVASAVGEPDAARLAASGPRILLVVFLGWAYWHVCRQHWGFVRIYARRGGETDRADDRMDRVFFHVALLVPPFLFLTHPAYPDWQALYPRIGLHDVRVAGASVAAGLHAALWAVWGANLVTYVAWQVGRARRDRPPNAPKLLLLGAVVPVHLAAFLHPAVALFSQVIVGVGHAVQYQRIVWRYGRRRYAASGAPSWPRRIFASPWVYLGCGVVFTLVLLRGPWIEWLIARGGAVLTGSMQRLVDVPIRTGARPIGAAMLWGLFLGWLFQHYYLDAKIWKVRSAEVRRDLGIDDGGVRSGNGAT